MLVVGQDPYPTPGHPVGLSFSVAPDVRPLPKSLVNIYTELVDDLGVERPGNGDLSPWADAGVLLLNRCLTVAPRRPASHRGRGWEAVTEQAIHALVARGGPLAAILWGRDAQGLKPMLGGVPWVESVHPSPLSAHRGFFGSRAVQPGQPDADRAGRYAGRLAPACLDRRPLCSSRPGSRGHRSSRRTPKTPRASDAVQQREERHRVGRTPPSATWTTTIPSRIPPPCGRAGILDRSATTSSAIASSGMTIIPLMAWSAGTSTPGKWHPSGVLRHRRAVGDVLVQPLT